MKYSATILRIVERNQGWTPHMFTPEGIEVLHELVQQGSVCVRYCGMNGMVPHFFTPDMVNETIRLAMKGGDIRTIYTRKKAI